MSKFDPNAPSSSQEGIYGLPFSYEEAALVILPIPFEATTSYMGGTSKAPQKISEVSVQVDLYHPIAPSIWKKGIHLLEEDASVQERNEACKAAVEAYRSSNYQDQVAQSRTRELLESQRRWTYRSSKEILNDGKILGTLGGDHSTPLGSIQACLEKFPHAGILHIDAHYDLRKAYEGFEQSHASIMWNVLDSTELSHLTSVGIRDYCEEEVQMALEDKRIHSFTDHELFSKQANGTTWHQLCKSLVESLPNEVYVSFDIDGLQPDNCPSTGTPVPGGLSYPQACYLLRQVLHSGRRMIGFDLCEVGPQEYDANVGARMLYELGALSLASNN